VPGVLTGIIPQNCPVCGSLVFVEAPPPSVVVTDDEFKGRSFLRGLFKRRVIPDNSG